MEIIIILDGLTHPGKKVASFVLYKVLFLFSKTDYLILGNRSRSSKKLQTTFQVNFLRLPVKIA